MTQTESAALIAAAVAVVLGGIGLVAGLIGYVQGAAALRRATIARQRATAAEEAATQAREQAERAARAAERTVQAARSLGAELPPTGPIALVPDPAVPAADESGREDDAEPDDGGAAGADLSTDAVAVAVPAADAAGAAPDGPGAAELEGDPPPAASTDSADDAGEQAAADDPEGAASSLDATPPAEAAADDPAVEDLPPSPPEVDVADGPAQDPVAAGEPDPVIEDPAPQAAAARTDTTPRRTPASEATMDWSEALRTGAIPLPTVSRGTYAPPPNRTPEAATGPPTEGAQTHAADGMRFVLRHIGRQRYEVVNAGSTRAEGVSVGGSGEHAHLLRPATLDPADLAAGEALPFSILHIEGREPAVRITWLQDGEQATETHELP